MTLRLNGSTSGYTEIDAPAVAGSNTLVLPTGAGSAYQVVRNGATAGSLEFTDNIVSGTAVASTSGTSIDFTGIPSWVKRVTVMLDGVSTGGTSLLRFQLGDSGGIETTGYSGATAYAAPGGSGGTFNSNGFDSIGDAGAAFLRYGALTFTNLTGNVWVVFGSLTLGNAGGASAYAQIFSGSKTLSATLDRVRITTVNNTDTFDAGSINILWE